MQLQYGGVKAHPYPTFDAKPAQRVYRLLGGIAMLLTGNPLESSY
jgi:hypothetical protein